MHGRNCSYQVINSQQSESQFTTDVISEYTTEDKSAVSDNTCD